MDKEKKNVSPENEGWGISFSLKNQDDSAYKMFQSVKRENKSK